MEQEDQATPIGGNPGHRLPVQVWARVGAEEPARGGEAAGVSEVQEC